MKVVKEVFPVAPGGWVVVFTDHTAWFQRAEPDTISQSPLADHEETITALCKRLADQEGP
jgi:hypothetical protein